MQMPQSMSGNMRKSRGATKTKQIAACARGRADSTHSQLVAAPSVAFGSAGPSQKLALLLQHCQKRPCGVVEPLQDARSPLSPRPLRQRKVVLERGTCLAWCPQTFERQGNKHATRSTTFLRMAAATTSMSPRATSVSRLATAPGAGATRALSLRQPASSRTRHRRHRGTVQAASAGPTLRRSLPTRLSSSRPPTSPTSRQGRTYLASTTLPLSSSSRKRR